MAKEGKNIIVNKEGCYVLKTVKNTKKNEETLAVCIFFCNIANSKTQY